jgi:hypothetical protein
MHPVFYCIQIGLAISCQVAAQNPALLVLREPAWSVGDPARGISWIGLSKQYYGLVQWNATGAGILSDGERRSSAAFFQRDGIPGYSFYHLFLSHQGLYRTFKGLLQLRFSLVTVSERRPAFRLGATLQFELPLGGQSGLCLTLYDFTSFLLPRAAPARADPLVRLQAWQSPGRRLDLQASFDLSPSHPGPLRLGARIRLDEQWMVQGMLKINPIGFSLGTAWRSGRIKVLFSVETGILGMTPTLIFQQSQL